MYKPLHLKYRPQVFDDLVGREVIAKSLRNAIRLNKLNNSYLFVGHHGSGKTTIARILAKAMNCTNVIDGNPCNKCKDCILIDKGAHPDVMEIDGASNSGVDNVREILEISGYSSLLSNYKVFIIDEVHSISKQAFNTLLKTLEEPQEHVKFIMCSTEIHKIPTTIRDRSMEFVFGKIPTDKIADRLQYVANKENINISRQQIETLACRAQGSVRDGLMLLDMFDLSKTIEFDIVDDTVLANIYEQLIDKDLENVLNLYKRIEVPPLFLLNELLRYTMEQIKTKGKLLSVLSLGVIIKVITAIENCPKTIDDSLAYEFVILSIYNIIHEEGFKHDVKQLAKRFNGYVENDYEVVSRKGTRLTVLETGQPAVDGLYTYYPMDTAKILNNNKSINELFKEKIIKRGVK